MKRFIVAALLIVSTLSASAVLKEKDIKQTLSVLKGELTTFKENQEKDKILFQQMREKQKDHVIEFIQNSNQVALMLYSQQLSSIFDLTYACHSAHMMYSKFESNVLPFDTWRESIELEIERYNQLCSSLERIPDFILPDSAAMEDKRICRSLCEDIYAMMVDRRAMIDESQMRYEKIKEKLKSMDEYAQNRFDNIRQSVFVNGGESYIHILKSFTRYWLRLKSSVADKYRPNPLIHSQWKGPIVMWVFIYVIFFFIIASLMCWIFIRWILPKRFETEEFMKKRSLFILTASFISFGLFCVGLRFFTAQYFFIHLALGLFMEYAWLMGAILLSLLIRIKAEQVMNAVKIYTPITAIGFVIIVFRIIFIPNEVANIIFPMIVLLCAIWQLYAIAKHSHNIPHSDLIYTWISFIFILCSLGLAWVGYTLLAVQALIFWVGMLTITQTITCSYDIVRALRKKYIPKADTHNFRKTWPYDLVDKCMLPIVGVYSLMLALYYSARVFDMVDICQEDIFKTNFINFPGYIEVSLGKLSLVLALWFVAKFLVMHIRNIHASMAANRDADSLNTIMLGRNMASMVIWLLYIVISMLIMHINNYGIIVALGGLSTGVGFALKDTIENTFYGLSLMTGRLHIADVIECDGIRGKVVSINYQSTMIETVDGSLMAFQNAQLFLKNFKNLTRNHGFELVSVNIGVAYGTDIKNARSTILESIKPLDCYDHKRGVTVILDNFGDSSVDLSVKIWVPVRTKHTSLSTIRETIYSAFNSKGIEIPFPQRDIHIIK